MSRREERERREAEKRRGRGGNASFVLLAVAVLALLGAGFACVRTFSERSAGKKEYAALAAFAPGEGEQDVMREKIKGAGFAAADQSPTAMALPLMNFEALERENEDIWGWICLFGTDINLPIVSGEADYTQKTFSMKDNDMGCPFVSPYQAYGDGFHTVIYGTPAAQSMARYRKAAYREKNPLGVLYTKEKTYALRVAAAYRTEGESGYDQVAFADEADKDRYFAWLQEQDGGLSLRREQVGSLLTVSVPTGKKLTAVVFEMVE